MKKTSLEKAKQERCHASRRQRLVQILLWIAVAAWLGIALLLTLQNGTSSAPTSGVIAAALHRFLLRCGLSVAFDAFHMALRTAAHFLVFWVFGLLFAAATLWSKRQKLRRKHRIIILLVLTAVAIVPEVIKTWIPGRHLQWDEALLNLCGAYVGYAVVEGLQILRLGHVARK